MRRLFYCSMLMLLCAGAAFCQSSAFGMAAEGIAMEMVSVAKWIGIIIVILSGIALAAGEHHTHSKIFGLAFGLILALFAAPIVNWLQAL